MPLTDDAVNNLNYFHFTSTSSSTALAIPVTAVFCFTTNPTYPGIQASISSAMDRYRDCEVCLTSTYNSQFPRTIRSHGHNDYRGTCRNCWRQHINNHLQISFADNIPCAVPGCDQLVSGTDALRLLKGKEREN
ncbi:hypothetical protein KVT40_009252 [Elsinoe batatas]|uniref:Uncharacterized protein n=1 Tax=Elsinoe batatas TaxID=2601811 RepID=A0A8K0P926_9PEZI|nr:hypothetical protein KVT40_009252 [Elsinoe batatas]